MTTGELSIRNLRVRRGAFLLQVASLRVAPGEILCVMGPSGCGKSTLLDAIGGFLPVESGEIRLGEIDLGPLPPERRRLARVFQRPALFPHLSLRDNVAFALAVRGVPARERRARADEWLDRLAISELAERFPHQVSEGQGQRAAIARAGIARFPGLLLDEPFSALDEETKQDLRRFLVRLVGESRTAAVLVTHDPEDAPALGARVMRVVDGKLI